MGWNYDFHGNGQKLNCEELTDYLTSENTWTSEGYKTTPHKMKVGAKMAHLILKQECKTGERYFGVTYLIDNNENEIGLKSIGVESSYPVSMLRELNRLYKETETPRDDYSYKNVRELLKYAERKEPLRKALGIKKPGTKILTSHIHSGKEVEFTLRPTSRHKTNWCYIHEDGNVYYMPRPEILAHYELAS